MKKIKKTVESPQKPDTQRQPMTPQQAIQFINHIRVNGAITIKGVSLTGADGDLYREAIGVLAQDINSRTRNTLPDDLGKSE